MRATPTTEQFEAYQGMFDYFNRELFAGCLPQTLLNFSRHAGAVGFFAPERWGRKEEKRHEISLNPEWLGQRSARETASTLVHEQVHCWQQAHGKPSARGYHNREWAEKMEELGLVPSSTGSEGGKRTGFRMTHFIADGGPFARAFERMPGELLLPWAGTAGLAAEKKGGGGKRSKVKYSCPECGANAWGKPDLHLMCGECREDMTAPEGDDEGEED